MPRLREPVRGVTLIELLLVLALIGALSTTLWLTLSSVVARADGNRDREGRMNDVRAALAEIGQAIRTADEVLIAGPDVLVVKSRYHANADDSAEAIMYAHKGAGLAKQVALDGLNFGPQEWLIDEIDSFEAFNFRLIDRFEMTGVGWKTAFAGLVNQPRTYDTSVATVYDTLGLSGLDGDLLACYDSISGQVTVFPMLGKVVVTVSPPLRVEDLVVRVHFVPVNGGGAYSLILGPEGDAIELVFRTDGTIALQRTAASAIVDQQTGVGPWVAGTRYELELVFGGGRVRSLVTVAGSVLFKDAIRLDTFASGQLSFIAHRTGRTGVWDDLFVGWEVVRVDLGLDLGSGVETFTSKVGPRAWQ